MSGDSPDVDCGSHGKQVAAVVCCHMLRSSEAVGFIENSSDPNDLQAWCQRCEDMFLAEGDKTEAFEAFNDRALVCCVCYAALKARHSHNPQDGREKNAGPTTRRAGTVNHSRVRDGRMRPD